MSTAEVPGIEPVVLPFRPRQGWREAGKAQRAFAVLCAALVSGWLASLGITEDQLDELDSGSFATTFRVLYYLVTLAVFFVGPPAFYAAARVLRPHPPGTGTERMARHWCAAIATAYGVALLTWIGGAQLERGFPLSGYGAGWFYILVASTLGPVTVVWGLVAAALRADARIRAHLLLNSDAGGGA